MNLPDTVRHFKTLSSYNSDHNIAILLEAIDKHIEECEHSMLLESQHTASPNVVVNLTIRNDGSKAFKRLARKLDALQQSINENQEETHMALENIESAVTAETTVIGSVVTLLDKLADEVRANAGNVDASNALAQRINDNANALAAAVARDTMADAETPVEPPTGGTTPPDTGTGDGTTGNV